MGGCGMILYPYILCLSASSYWIKRSVPACPYKVDLMVHVILNCSLISHHIVDKLNKIASMHTSKIALEQSLSCLHVYPDTMIGSIFSHLRDKAKGKRGSYFVSS